MDKRGYVDEAGFDSYLLREYARAPKGQKIYEKIQGRKYQRTSIAAAQCGRKITAPLEWTFSEIELNKMAKIKNGTN